MEDVTPADPKQSRNPNICRRRLSSPLLAGRFRASGRHVGRRADLIDDGEDGVDEHQVARLQRQVACLLQGKQHCADQGDLSGA